MTEPDIGARAEYDRQLAQMEDVIEAIVGISDGQGGIWISHRHTEATNVFTRITVTGITFLRLLPGNSLTRGGISKFWDWPSAGSICRNIIDAYLMFFYFGLDPISDEEWQFRYDHSIYHHNSEKYRLYRDWGASADVLAEFEEKLPALRATLSQNSLFQRMPKWQQKRVTDGEHPMYLSRAQLLNRIPFSTDDIPLFYRLLSNQVHATPFSFQRYSNKRGRGLENEAERGYMVMAMWLARKYLGAAGVGMGQLFPNEIGTGRAQYVSRAKRHLEAFTPESGVPGA